MPGKIDELVHKFYNHGELVAAFKELDDYELFAAQYYEHTESPDVLDEMEF